MRTPHETLDRCALRAQLRGDPMLGTAFPAARLLLVEQPGAWGRAGLTQSRFPAEFAAQLQQRAVTAGLRLQAIRRPGRSSRTGPYRWGYADTRDGQPTVRWSRWTTPEELLDIPLDGSVGTPDPDPVFLVCTHSRRDTCCALRGRPVAAALQEHVPGQVWESSHLGGDRFGANVLVLPLGLLYGRVLPFATEQLVSAARGRELVPALLRGRIGLAPVAQAALGFAHEQLGVRHSGTLAVASVGGVGAVRPGEAVVRIADVEAVEREGDANAYDVTVAVATEDVVGLTCHTPGPGRFVTYRPVRIEPVR